MPTTKQDGLTYSKEKIKLIRLLIYEEHRHANVDDDPDGTVGVQCARMIVDPFHGEVERVASLQVLIPGLLVGVVGEHLAGGEEGAADEECLRARARPVETPQLDDGLGVVVEASVPRLAHRMAPGGVRRVLRGRGALLDAHSAVDQRQLVAVLVGHEAHRCIRVHRPIQPPTNQANHYLTLRARFQAPPIATMFGRLSGERNHQSIHHHPITSTINHTNLHCRRTSVR